MALTKVSGSVWNPEDNTYTSSNTGSTERTLQSKLGDTLNIKDFGAIPNSSASSAEAANTAAFTSMLAAAVSDNRPLLQIDDVFYFDPLTIDATAMTILGNGRMVFGSSGVFDAITIAEDDITFDGIHIIGPQKITAGSVAYVGGERGIVAEGLSTGTRYEGLTMHNCKLEGFGSYGLYAQYLNDISITKTKVFDCGYTGLGFLSCDNGLFSDSSIERIGPGSGGNMYGIIMTHDATGWPAAESTDPFSRNWRVLGNFLNDINWEPIDTHGGWNILVAHNQVFNSYGGIAITSSSGDALGYTGGDISVIHNLVDGRNPDGSASGRENLNYGINISGGTNRKGVNMNASHNIIIAKGDFKNTNSGAIQAQSNEDATCIGNVIRLYGGNGINFNATDNAIANENKLLSIAAGETGANGIHQDVAGAHKVTAKDNIIVAPVWGIRSKGTIAPVVGGNDITAAADVYTPDGVPVRVGTEASEVLDTSADTTFDASDWGMDCVFISAPSAPKTITNFTGAKQYQKITILNASAHAITLDRSNSVLSGATNWVSDLNDTITLMYYGSTWKELSRSLNG